MDELKEKISVLITMELLSKRPNALYLNEAVCCDEGEETGITTGDDY